MAEKNQGSGSDRLADIELLRLHLQYGLLHGWDARDLATRVYLDAFPPHGGVQRGEEAFLDAVEAEAQR